MLRSDTGIVFAKRSVFRGAPIGSLFPHRPQDAIRPMRKGLLSSAVFALGALRRHRRVACTAAFLSLLLKRALRILLPAIILSISSISYSISKEKY
jgi:hypothetical protein